MSQAEALLNSISDELPVHEHPVPDTDAYYTIDPITRQISNTNSKKNVVMQYDHNSERLTFELPRFVDGHDMLKCTSVTVNVDNIEDGELKLRTNSDAPDITDLRAHPNDPDKVICSWLISRNSTQLAGIISFHIEFKCVDSNGDVVYEWSTDTYDEIEVRARKKNGEAAILEHTDLLEQWRTSIFGAGDSVMANISAEGQAQVAAIQAESENQKEAVALKGEETLETIPDDYETTSQMAEDALRRKANAIALEASGTAIVVNDSSDAHLLGLKLYGNTTQVKTTGKQLLRVTKTSEDINGGKLVVNSDGSLLINGTISKNTSFAIGKFMSEGELILSLEVTGSRNASYVYIGIDADNNIGWYGEDKKFTGDGTERTLYAVIIAGTYNNTIFYPMIRKASIADGSYEPYSGGGASPSPDWPQELASIENPTAYIFGKNLLNSDLLVGGTFVKNDDGTYTFTKTENNATSATCPLNLPAGDYVLSWEEAERNCESYRVYVNYANGTTQLTGLTNLGTNKLVLSTEVGIKDIRLSLASNVTNDTYVKFAWMQLEVGTEATEYEPYQGIQTILLNRTLRSLPAVRWDGSTDEGMGGMVRDYVDLERGVLVQKIGLATMNSGAYTSYSLSSITGRGQLIVSPDPVKHQRYFSTQCNIAIRNGTAKNAVDGEYYENPANIVFVGDLGDDEATIRAKYADFAYTYVLETPIEIPLTDEEITYFKRLKTIYHDTTVLNDSGAYMDIKYAADTLIYLRDNQPKPTDEQVRTAVGEYAAQNGVQVPSDDHIRSIVNEVLGGIVNGEY